MRKTYIRCLHMYRFNVVTSCPAGNFIPKYYCRFYFADKYVKDVFTITQF